MGKLRKLTAERRWALSQWERCGWSIPRIGFEAKKWRAHIAALVMMGLLEEISGGGLYRITEAGLAALNPGAPK